MADGKGLLNTLNVEEPLLNPGFKTTFISPVFINPFTLNTVVVNGAAVPNDNCILLFPRINKR